MRQITTRFKPCIIWKRSQLFSAIFLLYFTTLCTIRKWKGWSDESSFRGLEEGQMKDQPKGYVIPYLKGQGLNNQLWEYRTAAIVARATNRVLCLEPFHRFYLQKLGREFIPFEELFDAETMNRFVHNTDRGTCSSSCNRKIDSYVEFSPDSTSSVQKPFSIPNWRPGSKKKFLKSSGFTAIPPPTYVIKSRDYGRKLDSMKHIKKSLSSYNLQDCISVSGVLEELRSEFLLWSQSLQSSKSIKHAVNEVKALIFGEKPYLAIHWRFEESKCAGLGIGIGFGRASNIKHNQMIKSVVRRSDRTADLCFFAGIIPKEVNRNGTWIRLISEKAIVNWIQKLKQERRLQSVYISTDCHDPALLHSLKLKTGAITKSDIMKILSKHMNVNENDVLSRVEQEICVEAEVFAGTLYSSWTGTVIEERFSKHNLFFMQNKRDIRRRPDPRNRTFYLDIESCDCDWNK